MTATAISIALQSDRYLSKNLEVLQSKGVKSERTCVASQSTRLNLVYCSIDSRRTPSQCKQYQNRHEIPHNHSFRVSTFIRNHSDERPSQANDPPNSTSPISDPNIFTARLSMVWLLSPSSSTFADVFRDAETEETGSDDEDDAENDDDACFSSCPVFALEDEVDGFLSFEFFDCGHFD